MYIAVIYTFAKKHHSQTPSQQKDILETPKTRTQLARMKEDTASLHVHYDASSVKTMFTDNLSKFSRVFNFDPELRATQVYDNSYRSSVRRWSQRKSVSFLPAGRASGLRFGPWGGLGVGSHSPIEKEPQFIVLSHDFKDTVRLFQLSEMAVGAEESRDESVSNRCLVWKRVAMLLANLASVLEEQSSPTDRQSLEVCSQLLFEASSTGSIDASEGAFREVADLLEKSFPHPYFRTKPLYGYSFEQ